MEEKRPDLYQDFYCLDKIIIVTSRKAEYREETVRFLRNHEIRYDMILFDMPMGERIVVNDRKPSGLDMAVA